MLRFGVRCPRRNSHPRAPRRKVFAPHRRTDRSEPCRGCRGPRPLGGERGGADLLHHAGGADAPHAAGPGRVRRSGALRARLPRTGEYPRPHRAARPQRRLLRRRLFPLPARAQRRMQHACAQAAGDAGQSGAARPAAPKRGERQFLPHPRAAADDGLARLRPAGRRSARAAGPHPGVGRQHALLGERHLSHAVCAHLRRHSFPDQLLHAA